MKKLLIAAISALAIVLFSLTNITNNVLDFGLALLMSLVAIMYTYLFVCPPVFALTFVRKIKKERQKEKVEEAKLNEAEVLKETDLDNLVSN